MSESGTPVPVCGCIEGNDPLEVCVAVVDCAVHGTPVCEVCGGTPEKPNLPDDEAWGLCRDPFHSSGGVPGGEQTKERTMSGVNLIAAERERQVSEEGWTPEHDDEHTRGELVNAAIAYAEQGASGDGFVPPRWPWESSWWKPTHGDRGRALVKAGALIAAEIDRLQRGADRG